MAPRKKTAAAAPVSALAARKAREQAEAQRSKTTRASTSKTDEATSTPRSSRRSASGRHDAQADLDGHENTPVLEVVLPLATASQESAHAALPPPPTSRRRSSVSQATSLIATSRPRRSSSTATSVKPGIGQSGSTPRATKGAATKTLQSTPSRGSARKVSSSSATPASSSKKRKATRTSEDDLDQAVQDILDELHFGNSDDDDDDNPALAASEQPPRKKRASQPSKSRTPVKSPVKSRSTMTVEADSSAKTKRTPVKRSSARSAPAEKTPSRKASAKAAESERPKRGTPANETTPSKRKSDERRSKAAQRYFAGSASSHGKTRVGSSSLPSEDQATGFLAFANDGDDDDDDDDDDDESGATSAIGQQDETEEVQSDADTPNSSEDDEQQDEKVAGTSAPTPMPRRSKATRPPSGRKGKGRYVEEAQSSEMVLDSDEERPEDAQTAPPALTRASLLDAIPYSNFIPVPHGSSKNVHVVENKRKRGKEALYFGLRHGETLVFLGIGQVEVLKGSAQIGGAVISSSAEGFKMTQLYAPICNPLPVLKSVPQKQYPGQGVSQKVSHGTGLEMRDLPFGECDTVVKVSPLSSPITALGQVCPIGGLATPFSMPPHLELGPFHQLSTLKVLIAPETVEVAQKQKNVLANGTFSTVGLSATYVPHKWQNELHRLSASALSAAQHPQEESVIALVRGSKKVGKSTLSRMALERLRSMGASIGGKVAYLEMDLGQSDFGPPGMVALHVFSLDDNVQAKPQQDQDEHSNPDEHMHESTVQVATEQARRCITLGPGWCQPRVPARAHLIGDNSPRDDPESYVAAVHDLIEYFRAEIQPGDSDGNGDGKRVPLVINTQGWIKGLGADLAVRLEPMLRPTHIFDVVPRGSPDPVPAPSRGRPWLDADGAILGSGPEIVTLESVSQLEFVQGAFGQRDSNSSNNQHHASVAQNGLPGQADESKGSGDGGSTPPRYISDVGSKLQPAESRLLNMMSYLYATQLSPARIGNAYQTQGTWEFSGPLVDRPPLVIDVRQGLKAGIRVLPLGSSVPDELKLKAINSSIVAIVASQSSDRQADGENAEAVKGSQVGNIWKQAFDRAAQTSQPGRNPPTWCVGLGVVRSVDPESGSVHLLTPLSPAFLHELQSTSGCSFGLVKAALELPAWASLDFEAIKEARESRLDVPPSSFHALVTSEAAHTLSEERAVPLLAGMPRNQVPYLEWPHVAHAPIRQKGKHAGTHGNMQDSTSGSMPSTPVQLGSGKRRVRRNLMRKSQFA